MHIDNHQDVIAACRFCFMCRHLDPVGNVTFHEADTPRGRALILDRVRMDRRLLETADFIATLYRSALSGANRRHCVSSYDETGLVLAARRDVVDAGLAPEPVKALAEELGGTSFQVSGSGDVLYHGTLPDLYPGCKTLAGGDPGAALEALGFAAESRRVFERFREAVAESRCKALIVAEPSAYHFLKTHLERIKVIHCSEHLLSTLQPGQVSARRAFYLESDFLQKDRSPLSAPRRLLERCGFELLPVGTNGEESYAAGEGAVVYDQLYPALAEKLCQRVYGLTHDLNSAEFVTPSLYVKATLSKYNPRIRIATVEEAVAACKCHLS